MGPGDTMNGEGGPRDDLPRLTEAEDAELRQLTWFAKLGHLSETSQARLSELKARDRRDGVRDARPDPVSRADEPADVRLQTEVVLSSRCRNCGFAGPKPEGPAKCPSCGFSAPAA